MMQFLLSVHAAQGTSCHSKSPEEMQESFARIEALEAEMKAADAMLFTGRLTEPEGAKTVREENGETMMTDGLFAESKEHLAGFYILQAADLEAALGWASKVTSCIGQPIEVRPFWSPPGS